MARKRQNKKENNKSYKEQRQEHEQDALFREVWEDVSQQKVEDFFKKHWKYMLVLVVLILGSVIGHGYYLKYKNKEMLKEAAEFDKAMDLYANGNVNKAQDDLKVLYENADYGYRDVAYSNLYNIYLGQKKSAAAIAVLDAMSKKGYSDAFKDEAKIKKVYLTIDSIKTDEARKILETLIDDKSPFMYSAKILLGFVYGRDKDYKNAYKYFEEVSNDDNAPLGHRSTASNMTMFLKPRLSIKK